MRCQWDTELRKWRTLLWCMKQRSAMWFCWGVLDSSLMTFVRERISNWTDEQFYKPREKLMVETAQSERYPCEHRVYRYRCTLTIYMSLTKGDRGQNQRTLNVVIYVMRLQIFSKKIQKIFWVLFWKIFILDTLSVLNVYIVFRHFHVYNWHIAAGLKLRMIHIQIGFKFNFLRDVKFHRRTFAAYLETPNTSHLWYTYGRIVNIYLPLCCMIKFWLV